MLVDLLTIDPSNRPREVSVNAAANGGRTEPDLAKSKYLETDPNYVPPPNWLDPELQSQIDANLLEVFNLYCRKFA